MDTFTAILDAILAVAVASLIATWCYVFIVYVRAWIDAKYPEADRRLWRRLRAIEKQMSDLSAAFHTLDRERFTDLKAIESNRQGLERHESLLRLYSDKTDLMADEIEAINHMVGLGESGTPYLGGTEPNVEPSTRPNLIGRARPLTVLTNRRFTGEE